MSRTLLTTTSVVLLLFLGLSVGAQSGFLIDFLNLKEQSMPPTDLLDHLVIAEVEGAWNEINNRVSPVSLSPVIVGIIDSGIDASDNLHPEFRGVQLGNTPVNTRKDSEREGHGTQVAGIIGANNISATGSQNYEFPQMNGILSGALDLDYTLENRKPTFFGFFFNANAFSTMAQINNLAKDENKVDIISIQNNTPTVELATLLGRILFERAVGRNSVILFVLSAGNLEFDFAGVSVQGFDAKFVSPANLGENFDNVITVGATDENDNRADFSNFGDAVNIAAPGFPGNYAPAPRGSGTFPSSGVNVNNYDRSFAGTSAAAPMVTGVAGLLKAINPSLTPAEIKNILVSTADVISTDKPIGPRLNAFNAVCHEDVLDCGGPTIVSGTLTVDTTWTLAQSPFVVRLNPFDRFTIPASVTLTIEPGVVVKFEDLGPITSEFMVVEGALNANGTSTQPIFFTSIKDDAVGGDTNNDGAATAPDSGDWGSVEVKSGGVANLTQSTVRFGGAFGSPAIIVRSGGVLTLSDSHLTQNGRGVGVFGGTAVIADSEIDTSSFGIDQRGGTATVNQSRIHDNGPGILSESGTLTVTNTDFQDNNQAMFLFPDVDFIHSGNTASNNGINGIVMSGTLTVNRTWTRDTIPYVIFSGGNANTVVVDPGAALTIDPGAVVKFGFNVSAIIVNGTLNANGTVSQPIFFTSIKDDSVGGDTNNDGNATSPSPFNWQHIRVNTGGVANFTRSTIRFGGASFGGFPNPGGIIVNGGTAGLNSSHMTQNGSNNLLVLSGASSIISSEIDTAQVGLRQIGGTVTVSQSSIHDNASFGVFNTTPTTMNAENNWWGDASGPFHPTLNPGGLGNSVSDNVDFIPFLSSDPVGSLP